MHERAHEHRGDEVRGTLHVDRLAGHHRQPDLDRGKPRTSRHVTQRREDDVVEILSGVYEGKTTGTPIALLIRNTDAKSKDYAKIATGFPSGHAGYNSR